MMGIEFDSFHLRKDFRLQISTRWNLDKDSLTKYIIVYLDKSSGWIQHTTKEYANKEEPIEIVKDTIIRRKNLGLDELPMKVIKVTVSTEVVE